MELHVLGSSSAGNGYVLKSSSGECLIIEAGIPLKKAQPIFDFNPANVAGLILTHEHGDHAKHVKQYAESGINVYSSLQTLKKVFKLNVGFELYPLQSIGSYNIRRFNINHDAIEPIGFLISHSEAGTILFLTDTHFSNYTFPGVDHFIIEANYCEKILKQRIADVQTNAKVGDRVYISHMEIETTIELLKASGTEKTKTITLIHLSDKNSNAEDFVRRVQLATGVSKVEVAEPGKIIQLNKQIF